jgi:predicted NAD/FAD-dependent oxidoreductase
VLSVDPSGRVEYTHASAASGAQRVPVDMGGGHDKDRRVEHFDAVVVSAPLPQSAAMIDAGTPPEWPTAFMPNLTAILEYDASLLPASALTNPGDSPASRLYALYAPHDHPTLIWSACENAKVGRTIAEGRTVIIAQACDSFSLEHINDEQHQGIEQDAVRAHRAGGDAEHGGEHHVHGDAHGHQTPGWVEDLAGAVESMWGLDPSARVAAIGKRWRYARVDPKLRMRDITTVEQPAERLFVCGDGVARRSRLEHAVLNGHYAAERVAATFSARAVPAWSAV